MANGSSSSLSSRRLEQAVQNPTVLASSIAAQRVQPGLRSQSPSKTNLSKYVVAASSPRKAPSYLALLRQQQIELPGVLRELERCRRKENHWVWYVFPTEKEGLSD
eukprot:3574597-Amphidinium_carterae.1